MSDMQPLVAPFPWFGGKRIVAAEVWTRLGDCTNYVEPFFGSGAVLLARPHQGKTETVNDADHYIANFWRACRADPEAVATAADWPVNEADLQSRHWWLLTEGRSRIAACAGDADHYDAKVAGLWAWGACVWIGSGWCSGRGPWTWTGTEWGGGNAGQGLNRKLPHLGDADQGLNRQLPHLGNAGRGLNRKLPHLGDAGRGLNRQLPHLGNAGRGLNRKLPHLGDAGRGQFVHDWISALSTRLRDVRVACGDWSRVCGDSVTHRHGLTGVFLDPPYSVDDRAGVYTHDCRNVAAAARVWAIQVGARPDMRVALAGYAGEHDMPAGWTTWAWKANGGYGSQGTGQGRDNCERETIWFSPACIQPLKAQADLFAPPVGEVSYDRPLRSLFADAAE